MIKHLLAWNVHAVSNSVTRIQAPFDIRLQIQNTVSLPLLSSSCRDLMQMMSADSVDLDQFVEIVERDPLLTIQIFRAANSAFYNYRGKLESINEAVVRVIGMDKALFIALGLATANSLLCDESGCLGMKTFWIHAHATNRLLTRLCFLADPLEESGAEIQLAGLLHNIGYPLLGHFYPDVHYQLGKLIQDNPIISNLIIEKFSLGISHCEIGAWLSKAWELPESVSCVILNHHDGEYRQKYWRLNLMVHVCDNLLASHSVGVDALRSLDKYALTALAIDNSALDQLRQEVPAIIESTLLLADQIFDS